MRSTAARAGSTSVSCSRRAASRWSPVQITRTAVAVALPSSLAQVAAHGLDEQAPVGDLVGASGSGTRARPIRLVAKSSYQPVQTLACLPSSSRRAPCALAVGRAVVALPQVEHRVGRQPQAGDAGDQAA